MSSRVLHVYRTFFPDTQGGLEEVVRQIILNTASTVTGEVLTVSRFVNQVDCCEVNGIPVTRLPLLTDIASSSLPKCGLSIFRERARSVDLIHYHMPWPVGDVFHFLGRVKVPAVVTYHSDIVRQRFSRSLYAPLMHHFLRSVDRIVATSPHYRDSSAVLQRYRNKTDVIPIGIDPGSYPGVDAGLRRAWTERIGRNFFFFIGVLRYYKGLDVLIRASKKSDLPVVIAGAGPEEPSLKKLANELGADRVRFVGRISDADKMVLLSLCRAFVLPSYLRSEAFGVCLLEAQMMAKPLITVEIGSGMSYVNQHNETGLIVAPKSPQGLAAAMQKLASDTDLAQTLGSGGRARFEALFTGAEMGRAYTDLYRRVLAARV